MERRVRWCQLSASREARKCSRNPCDHPRSASPAARRFRSQAVPARGGALPLHPTRQLAVPADGHVQLVGLQPQRHRLLLPAALVPAGGAGSGAGGSATQAGGRAAAACCWEAQNQAQAGALEATGQRRLPRRGLLARLRLICVSRPAAKRSLSLKCLICLQFVGGRQQGTGAGSTEQQRRAGWAGGPLEGQAAAQICMQRAVPAADEQQGRQRTTQDSVK